MSTTLVNRPGFTVTRYWGGNQRGTMVQVHTGSYLTGKTVEMPLTKFVSRMRTLRVTALAQGNFAKAAELEQLVADAQNFHHQGVH